MTRTVPRRRFEEGGRERVLLVETRGQTKRYGSMTPVDELDLTVRCDEVYGFLGPNEAGKTTTTRFDRRWKILPENASN
jgi:ABC-type transporter Mla maintaining outer membrane lipid asymmetry ATPase subunit MlaF